MSEPEKQLQPSPRHAQNGLPTSDERFRGAFESSAIGLAIVDLDGTIREVNRSLGDMLGYSRGELLGTSFFAIAHPDDLPLESPRESLLTGAVTGLPLEKRYLHRTGHTVWAELSVSVVRDEQGQPAYYISQAVDITARKDADQVTKRRAAELERSNAELEEFAYVAAHELREPLRTVTSYVQVLADKYREKLDARAKRWIRYIVEGVERMQRFIEDLLTLADISTGGVLLRPTDIGAVVARMWKAMETHHLAVEAHLEVGSLPTLDADEGQMEQLFRNLLDNAIRYRQPGAPLLVDVSVARVSRGHDTAWEFTVRDNGVGFDMAHAERIFRMFERANRSSDGTGIGLAICKRIVERHGGRIRSESTPGEGSAFIFTLAEHAE
jgi:PAS domain S-box-containing protein